MSCGPENLGDMIRQIRDIEQGLGDGMKRQTEGETASLAWARKSLVAARQINAGESVGKDDLKTKRPGTGISPDQINEVIGKKAKIGIKKDHLIKWENLV